SEIATRGRTVITGGWWALVGGLTLWFTWHSPIAASVSDAARPVILFLGSGIGLSVLFARGLGPVAGALSLSQLSIDPHQRARTAAASELRQAGLMPRTPDAIYLGRFLDNSREHDVGYPGGLPLVTIGSRGVGKGTGIIIPNLSTLRRSILIIDPNGE